MVYVIGIHSLVQIYIVITLPVFDKFAASDFIDTTLLAVDRAEKVLQQIVEGTVNFVCKQNYFGGIARLYPTDFTTTFLSVLEV